jgi:carotenoid cleavage dioxygenase-like enzyme
VVVMDLPVTFSMKSLIGGHSFPYRWNPEHQARIGLLPRGGRGSETIWVDVDPCYIFHVANAFDLPDGRVVLDAVVYNTMFADSAIGPDAMSRGLERWTIDPVAGTVERRTIDATPQEFPRPDERRFGQSYRYAYTLGLPRDSEAFIGETFILKHDLETGGRAVHEFGAGRYPGEFVFVPAHADAGEDEGWLIGLVVDLPLETTDLAIIDARDFAGAPVASIRLPHRVPPGRREVFLDCGKRRFPAWERLYSAITGRMTWPPNGPPTAGPGPKPASFRPIRTAPRSTRQPRRSALFRLWCSPARRAT